jgi:hypothetical protein
MAGDMRSMKSKMRSAKRRRLAGQVSFGAVVSPSEPVSPATNRIWFFHVGRDSQANIESIVSSTFVTHVLIYVGNRHTNDYTTTYDSLLRYVVSTIRKAGKKSGIVRNFWPTTTAKGHDATIMFSSSYYAGEVAALMELRAAYGCDYIGFDMEAYAPSTNPVYPYLSWADNYVPTADDIVNVNAAVSYATGLHGQVDYIYPGGSVRTYHFYNLLDSLAMNSIITSTYYDKPVDIANQIAGKTLTTVFHSMYLHTTKENVSVPENQYYLCSEIAATEAEFEGYGGVFLYPKEDNVTAVIAALLAIG